MTLLQLFFIVSGFSVLLIWYDIYKKQKFKVLHILFFLGSAVSLLIFTLFPNILQKFGKFVWVQRWADALVYISIIFLGYFVLFLLNKIEKNNSDITKLVRQIALLEYEIRKNDKK